MPTIAMGSLDERSAAANLSRMSLTAISARLSGDSILSSFFFVLIYTIPQRLEPASFVIIKGFVEISKT